MNVRQEGSPYGPGITFTEIGGQVTEAAIDLRRELALRSDGAEVGLIKRTRIQRVYPEFIATFCEAYRLHKQYLAGVSFEEDYAPMFVNRDGMAMSYESYRQKFKDLVNNHLRPELIKSSDPELRIYGQLLYENDLSTHCLRHWFTVQLVLRNKEIGDIQFWRGDKNPESAFTYMQNKGELTKALKHTNETLTEILIMLGGELYGKL
jgi:integrase